MLEVMASSPDNHAVSKRNAQERLNLCWSKDIDWKLLPQELKDVSFLLI